MTPQQLKAMKQALEALKLLTGAWQTFGALDYGDNAIAAIKEVLAEHAMQEVQRLGQEIEQCQCTECQIKPHASDCAVHSEPAYPKGKCDCGAQPQQEPPKYSFKAHWEKDGRIGVVGAVVRPDGGVHLLQDIIDPPQPEQEPVALHVYKPTLPRGHLGNVSDGDLPWVYDQDPSSGYSARMLVHTTPPQRKPLTDEKINKMHLTWVLTKPLPNVIDFARAIEAAHGIKEHT